MICLFHKFDHSVVSVPKADFTMELFSYRTIIAPCFLHQQKIYRLNLFSNLDFDPWYIFHKKFKTLLEIFFVRNLSVSKQIYSLIDFNGSSSTTFVKSTSNPSHKFNQNSVYLIKHFKLLIVIFNKSDFLKSICS